MNRCDDLAIARERRGAASLVTPRRPPDGRRDLAVFIDDIVLADPSRGLPFCLWVNSVLASKILRRSNFSLVGFGALLQPSGSGYDRPSKCEP
jgi:hypothetical protein